MLRIFAVFLFLLTDFLSALPAQQTAVEIDPGLQTLPLDQQLWFVEDSERKFQEGDILKPEFQDKFAPNGKKTPNFGFSPAAWWARVLLRNTSDKPLTVYVTEGYAVVDHISFWHVNPEQGALAHVSMGDRTPHDPKRSAHRLPTFRMDLPPGDSWLYVRIQTEGSVIFDLKLHGEEAFHQSKTDDYVFAYTLLGILLVMALYNLFIWMQLRKLTYLVYVGFIVTMIWQPLAYSGLAVLHISDYTWFMNSGYIFVANKSTLFACLFPVLFLSLKGRHPWLLRLCYAGMIFSVVSDIALLSGYNLGAKLSVLAATLASFITLTAGIVCSLKRFRPAYFFTLAWIVMIVANVVRMAVVAGHMPASFLAEWGVLIGSVVEVVLISLALADKVRLTEQQAFERIELLNQELKKEHDAVVHLNNNLERMVEEQTREIKSILKHIQIGIVVIGKNHLEITDTYSESAKTIFKTEKIGGVHAVDLLFANAAIDSDVKSQVRSVLENCIGEAALNFELNSNLLPHEMTYLFGLEQRVLQFDWNPVMDKDGSIEKMLISIKDVTALKQLEAEAHERSRELECIGEILDVTPRNFGIFIDSAQRFLADNLRLLKANLRFDKEVLKILLINMHTIKGSARSLGLKNLTPMLHDCEQLLAQTLNKEVKWDHARILQGQQIIQNQIDIYQQLNQAKLGRNSGDSLTFSTEFVDRMQNFLRIIADEGPTQFRQKAVSLKDVIENLTFIPAETVFREVLGTADMLARDLRKEPPVIEVQGHSIHLSMEAQELVRNTFVHIIRNSMDHGIETASERSAMGKPPEGHIQVSVSLDAGQLVIVYHDDGRGLNLRAIRRMAMDRGLLRPDQNIAPEDLAYLIFEPGFSTVETVNEISGRGVGMSAVKDYIEVKGGQVSIELLTKAPVVNLDFVPFNFVFRLMPKLCIQRVA
jgi:HPt (histidine-containing phosphotransfer) domain-containing protein